LTTACAAHLDSFPVFSRLVKTILRKVPVAVNRLQQRILLRCACNILDVCPPTLLDQAKEQFLPQLFRFLIFERTLEADEEMSENVALTLVKLAPNEDSLNTLILRVCGQLRRRKQSARDAARNALKKICKYLGVEKFPMVYEHLLATLREGGYQVHVLGYTTHILVESLKEELDTSRQMLQVNGEPLEEEAKTIDEFRKNGLDSILDKIVAVVEEETFGENAPTQEHGYHAKIHLREAKAGKNYDTLEALASCIAFLPCDSIHRLTRPFRSRLQSVSAMLDPSTMNKCRDALARIKIGLLKNKDVKPETLLVYVHTVLREWIDNRDLAKEATNSHGSDEISQAKSWLVRDDAEGEVVAISAKGSAYASRLLYAPGVQLTGRSAEKRQILQDLERKAKNAPSGVVISPGEHILVEFALDLLNSFVFRKTGPLKTRTVFIEHKTMVISLVHLLVKEIVMVDSASNRAIVLCLRICNRILEEENEERTRKKALTLQSNGTSSSLTLPREIVKTLTTRSLKFVKQNSISSSIVSADISRASVELLTTLLIRDQDQKTFNADDIKLLIRVCRLDLDDINRIPVALNLLKCIFERKTLLPEMYDVALRLTQLVFQSDRSRERSRCSDIVSHFLMEYPLEEQRIKEQLDLVLKNLDFPQEDGRISGLNMLRICIQRFPVEFIDESSEVFFFPLVVRLVNDDSPTVKESCAKVCVALLRRIGQKKLQNLVDTVLGWFDRANSLRAACQASGLIMESGRINNKTTLSSFSDKLLASVQLYINEGIEDASNGWDIVYTCLISLEKMLGQEKAEKGVILEKLDGYMLKLLLHPHAWIRLASNRLLQQRLRWIVSLQQDQKAIQNKTKKFNDASIPSKLTGFDVLLAVVDQLDSDILSDEMVQTYSSTIIDLIEVASRLPKWFISSSKTIAISETTNDDEEALRIDMENKQPISWLIKRLSIVASRPERDDLALKNRRRRAVFTVYSHVCHNLSKFLQDQMDDPQLIRSILKSVTVLHVSTANAADLDPLKEMCDSILDSLKNIIGADKFIQAMNDIRMEKVQRKQSNRKSKLLARVIPNHHKDFPSSSTSSGKLKTNKRFKKSGQDG
jgi:hypothetical protein